MKLFFFLTLFLSSQTFASEIYSNEDACERASGLAKAENQLSLEEHRNLMILRRESRLSSEEYSSSTSYTDEHEEIHPYGIAAVEARLARINANLVRLQKEAFEACKNRKKDS